MYKPTAANSTQLLFNKLHCKYAGCTVCGVQRLYSCTLNTDPLSSQPRPWRGARGGRAQRRPATIQQAASSTGKIWRIWPLAAHRTPPPPLLGAPPPTPCLPPQTCCLVPGGSRAPARDTFSAVAQSCPELVGDVGMSGACRDMSSHLTKVET